MPRKLWMVRRERNGKPYSSECPHAPEALRNSCYSSSQKLSHLNQYKGRSRIYETGRRFALGNKGLKVLHGAFQLFFSTLKGNMKKKFHKERLLEFVCFSVPLLQGVLFVCLSTKHPFVKQKQVIAFNIRQTVCYDTTYIISRKKFKVYCY